MILSLAQAVQLLEHAQHEHARECCGLLGGLGERVLRVIPCSNIAPYPGALFEIAPGELLDAAAALERDGLDLLAVYHSHPYGRPEPSGGDCGHSVSWPGVDWLIIGATGLLGVELRLWRIIAAIPEPVPLTITG